MNNNTTPNTKWLFEQSCNTTMNLEKHIYTSSNSYSFFDVVKASLKEYRNSFYLAKQLAKRDIKAR